MNDSKIKLAVVGATGYGGIGTIEILLRHARAEIVKLVSLTDVGRLISDVYPHLSGFCDLKISSLDDSDIASGVDAVFFATPDGVGQKNIKGWIDNGVKVIDFSGDFRFSNSADYAGYAARIGKPSDHASASLLQKSVYGVPELHRAEIAKAVLAGNPGCFAIACILGLAPAIKLGLVSRSSIICDCKSAVSGAGKKPSPAHHYPARYDSINAYKIASHQHVYEIERECSALAGEKVTVTFTPHVVPMTRGILATLYADLTATPQELLEAYRIFYKDEQFVRVLGPENSPSSSDVRGSNYVNIWVNSDPRTNKAIIVSHIDNLVKGQAGNAVQVMNIMTGLDESLGLNYAGSYP